jgi:hypothetical protein
MERGKQTMIELNGKSSVGIVHFFFLMENIKGI